MTSHKSKIIFRYALKALVFEFFLVKEYFLFKIFCTATKQIFICYIIQSVHFFNSSTKLTFFHTKKNSMKNTFILSDLKFNLSEICIYFLDNWYINILPVPPSFNHALM